MMLTPCWPSAGPTGGAGFAWPPGIWSLMTVRTFLAMSPRASQTKVWHAVSECVHLVLRSVDLLHLVERELDGHLPLEDVDEHLQLLLVGIDVDDLAVEVCQRAGGHLDGLAEL